MSLWQRQRVAAKRASIVYMRRQNAFTSALIHLSHWHSTKSSSCTIHVGIDHGEPGGDQSCILVDGEYVIYDGKGLRR